MRHAAATAKAAARKVGRTRWRGPLRRVTCAVGVVGAARGPLRERRSALNIDCILNPPLGGAERCPPRLRGVAKWQPEDFGRSLE